MVKYISLTAIFHKLPLNAGYREKTRRTFTIVLYASLKAQSLSVAKIYDRKESTKIIRRSNTTSS